MAISLWELRSNLSLKGATSNTERITRSSENYLRKRKVNTSMICYVVTWMKTVSLTVLFFTTTALSHCLSFLSAFFILSHFKIIRGIIIDRHFNKFFVEIQLKKENLKNVFWAPKLVYRSPKRSEYVTDYIPCISANSPCFGLAIWELSPD